MSIVYLITNKVTDKVYVGQTVEPLYTRWRKHKSQALCGRPTRIGKAIRKYGEHCFEIQPLCFPVSKNSLNNLERIWITLLRSSNEKYGYNITDGGELTVTTDAGIARMKASLTGRKLSKEHCKNLGEATRRRWADPLYKERVSMSISQATIGKSKSAYHRKRMSEGKTGKKLSELHVQHIQEGRQKFFKNQKEKSHACETN